MDEMITSRQNSRVKEVVRLRDRRFRERTGRFLIEGYRELKRAHEGGVELETLFVCPELFLGENEDGLIQAFGGRCVLCSKRVFEALSYRDRPDGLLGVAPQQRKGLDVIGLSENPFLVVAEAIEKPGNLGTILRSSDAAGVDGLVVCDRCTDVHNPNVVRASVGTLFTVPVVEATSEETLRWLRERGIQTLAATPAAEVTYTEVDMRGPLAIVVGTEQLGLSDRWREEADLQVRIPMKGVADSLNVAMATTVLLYEALKQHTH